MEISYFTIIFSLINLAIFFAIILVLYKLIQGFKNFIKRNQDMDKKIDIILSKLEDKK